MSRGGMHFSLRLSLRVLRVKTFFFRGGRDFPRRAERRPGRRDGFPRSQPLRARQSPTAGERFACREMETPDPPPRPRSSTRMTVSTPPFLDDPRPVSRRRALLLAAAALLLPPMRAAAQAVGSRGPGGTVAHPDPRPGVTAGAVLPPERVPEQAKEAYDAARAIPEVLDGLYCHPATAPAATTSCARCSAVSRAPCPSAAASARARRRWPGACRARASRSRRSAKPSTTRTAEAGPHRISPRRISPPLPISSASLIRVERRDPRFSVSPVPLREPRRS
jgi:hypothetical protein